MGRVGDAGPPEIGVIGRERELARIRRLLDPEDADRSPLLLVIGEPGSGKSTLLDAAAREAGRRGLRVLRCQGHEGETELVFAGLHQLLAPMSAEIRELPGPQRDALLRAFGLNQAEPAGAAGEPERLLINLAVLTLLSDTAYRRPLLVIADDAQWLDACSLDALTFAARRLAGEPVSVLAATRTDPVPEQFGAEFPRLPVSPLTEAAADRLLDVQPFPPAGPLRRQILRQAAGNPLALVELARATADSSASLSDTAVERLPLTARLERIFADRLARLPEGTRRALLFAAAADDPDLPAALLASSAAGPDGGIEAWLLAEQAGLVTLDSGRVAFRHPLMRSAVYQAASFAARREVHLALAEALAGNPDRRAWHLAAAALAPDEAIAAALEATADRARRRGGYRVAAAALERAARLSPDPQRQARRLLAACDLAMHAGRPLWVEQLTAGVVAATDDPELLTEAALWTGWALAATTRQKAALSHLLPLAASTVDTAPAVALSAVRHAAIVVYTMGDEDYRREALELLARIPADVGESSDDAWPRAALDPFGDRPGHLRLLERAVTLPGLGANALNEIGACAWVLDETATAVRLYGDSLEHLRRATTAGSNATLGQALAIAQFENGAWDAAEVTADDARRVAAENGLDMAGRSATYVSAALLAQRGDTGRARELIDRAVAGIDPTESRALQARALAVKGAIATVEGDHALAYELLRCLFTADPDPVPLHYHASHYGLGDLAAAAVRARQEKDAARVLDSVERRLAGRMSTRLTLLTHRARALLAPAGEAEEHFRAALADPAGEQWPFERAQARLEYAEWLRRRRRTGEARTALAQALAVFERLGARPWVARTTAELRACGVTMPVRKKRARPVDLTAQQLQIVRLAASGLTNREIGGRLLLSPRTVGFHLYQAFPKLGVTTRAQLRDALNDAELD
ncbi:helix-turn-helix transcriptional regulator [Actinoallomurus soli]|uniref:helix-turn-helix transcriptional regulator n=1 Tax=Actinoallomurus soli TaxID=2952535 RepID=UPI00209371A9|nr:LuxR family transcriptional regulator [Actinoallomurus soli]MCO5972650.1 AAA family ATPase [Actinoallomurus soli]